MQKIALFDIDNTIISVDSLINFIITLFKQNPIKLFYLPYLGLGVILKIFKLITTKQLKNIWLILIKNFTAKALDDFSRDYINNYILPTIKPNVQEKISALRNDGYKIIFATASFEFYAKYIAEHFHTDYFVGTKIAKIGNNYEIIGNNCKGQSKITAINEILPINDIDIVNSVSFSDSRSDLPFLDITGEFWLVHKTKWEVIEKIKSENMHKTNQGATNGEK